MENVRYALSLPRARLRLCAKLTFLMLIAPLFPLSAQTDSVLALTDCIRIAREQSPQVEIARKEYESTWYNNQLIYALQAPRLSLSGNIPGYSRQITTIPQPDGSTLFRAQEQALSSLSLNFSQSVPWTNTQISLSSGLSRVDLFSANESFWQSSPLLLNVRQPLFQYNDLRWDRERAPLELRVARRNYAETQAENTLNVVSRFFDLYLTQVRLENARRNRSINDTIFRIARGRYDVGKIAENELLQAELRLNSARTELAELELQRAQNIRQLNILLGNPAEQELRVTEPPLEIDAAPDEATALALAKSYRGEWLNYELRKLNAELDVRRERYRYSPDVNLNATVGFNQTAPTLDQSYQNLLDRQVFSIGFDIPIYQWGRAKAATGAAVANLEAETTRISLDKMQFEQNVEFAVRRFELSRSQLKLALRGDSIAQKRFEVAANRFLIGKIGITDLQIAQTEKDGARQTLINALREFWNRYYRLERLTLYDFRVGAPLIEAIDLSVEKN